MNMTQECKKKKKINSFDLQSVCPLWLIMDMQILHLLDCSEDAGSLSSETSGTVYQLSQFPRRP